MPTSIQTKGVWFLASNDIVIVAESIIVSEVHIFGRLILDAMKLIYCSLTEYSMPTVIFVEMAAREKITALHCGLLSRNRPINKHSTKNLGATVRHTAYLGWKRMVF